MSNVRLGLRENLAQFSLLVVVNAFVGAMVGMERTILPPIAEREFHLAAKTAVLSFIVVFGVTKALTNYLAGRLCDRFGRKHVLVGGWRDTAVEDEVGEDDGISARIQDQLDAFLRAHGVEAPVTHRWGGTMGFSHDGLPYIGKGADGIYRCGGFTGHGNGYALAAGELVSALIRTGSHPDAELFDPERA